MKKTNPLRPLGRAILVAVAAGALGGCAAFVAAGAAATAMVVVDRRTSGVQLEDQSIELKAASRITETIGSRGHVNVTSYNRTALITGEVPTEADRSAVEQAVSRIENVRSTVNELAVMAATSFTARSNDTVLTSKVKASYVDAKDLQVSSIKVVSERGTVFLMGRVTEREANRATELARGVSGVQKVVRVFEILTEAELAALSAKG